MSSSALAAMRTPHWSENAEPTQCSLWGLTWLDIYFHCEKRLFTMHGSNIHQWGKAWGWYPQIPPQEWRLLFKYLLFPLSRLLMYNSVQSSLQRAKITEYIIEILARLSWSWSDQCWNFITINKGWKWGRNRVLVPARQATKAGGIDSLELIPKLLKSLKILAQLTSPLPS